MSWAAFLNYNFKILFRKNLLAGLVYGLLVPFIFNLAHPVMISEIYLAPVGIIFLTMLTEIDKEDGMNEFILAREKGVESNFFTRYLIGITITAAVIIWFLSFLSVEGIDVNNIRVLTGTLITGIFLGTVGLTAANILRNYVAGYIISFSYFLFDFMTGGEYTGRLYLFSLSEGNFNPKYYLLVLIVVLLVINILLFKFRKQS